MRTGEQFLENSYEGQLRLFLGDELSEALGPDEEALFDATIWRAIPDRYPGRRGWLDIPAGYSGAEVYRLQQLLYATVDSERLTQQEAAMCAGWLGVTLSEQAHERALGLAAAGAGQAAIFNY